MVGRTLVALLFLGAAGLAAGTTDSEAPAFGVEFVVAETGSDAQVTSAGGNRFLVVWTEESGLYHRVRGQIFRAIDGERDGPSFVIAGDLPIHEWRHVTPSPAVATGNDNFLVAWTRLLGTPLGSRMELRAARVTLSGTVLDPEGFIVRDSGPEEYSPNHRAMASLAWDGVSWMVAWVETEWDSEPYVPLARIDQDGVVHSPGGFTSSACPRVAAASSRFLALTYGYDGDSTLAALTGPDGAIEDWTEIGGDSVVCAHDVASDGEDFLVAYACSAELESGDTACAEAATGTRLFSVEIDGETGNEREETRKVISGVVAPGDDWQRRRAAVAFGMDRWLVAREEFYAGRTDVFLDESLVLTSVTTPVIAFAADTGLVLARRDGAIIGRFFRFGETPGPSPTPTPSP